MEVAMLKTQGLNRFHPSLTLTACSLCPQLKPTWIRVGLETTVSIKFCPTLPNNPFCPVFSRLRSSPVSSPGNMDEVNTSQFELILGSSSVARRQILAEMGYNFTVTSADIDEKAIRKDKPEDLVMALAEAKADAIISKLQKINDQAKNVKPTVLIAADTAEVTKPKIPTGECRKDAESTVLITCDQVVVYEGKIREKPSSKEEAREFIKGYSGGHAATVSSVLVTNLKTGFRKGECDKVEIYFHHIPDKIVDELLEEGFVLNVAGGLIIEHPLIKPFVKQVVGSTDSVMGLPKDVCERLIKDAV